MSAIFVLVAVAFVLLVAALVFNTAAQDTSGLTASQQDSLNTTVDLLGTGIEIGALVPMFLILVLVAAVLGVWARI